MSLLHCLAGELHLLDELPIDTIVSETFVIFTPLFLKHEFLRSSYNIAAVLRTPVITIRRQK